MRGVEHGLCAVLHCAARAIVGRLDPAETAMSNSCCHSACAFVPVTQLGLLIGCLGTRAGPLSLSLPVCPAALRYLCLTCYYAGCCRY